MKWAKREKERRGKRFWRFRWGGEGDRDVGSFVHRFPSCDKTEREREMRKGLVYPGSRLTGSFRLLIPCHYQVWRGHVRRRKCQSGFGGRRQKLRAIIPSGKWEEEKQCCQNPSRPKKGISNLSNKERLSKEEKRREL